MGWLSNLFDTPKPQPIVIICNVLGEEIDHVNGRELSGQDLRGRRWNHANLSGLSLFKANCEGIQLLGARLEKTDFGHANLSDAELSYSYAVGASFRNANLKNCKMYLSQIGWPRQGHVPRAEFDGALINEVTDIAEHKVFAGERRWNS
jgi:uncharacterized protein YjbI with pentapeptide repeats